MIYPVRCSCWLLGLPLFLGGRNRGMVSIGGGRHWEINMMGDGRYKEMSMVGGRYKEVSMGGGRHNRQQLGVRWEDGRCNSSQSTKIFSNKKTTCSSMISSIMTNKNCMVKKKTSSTMLSSELRLTRFREVVEVRDLKTVICSQNPIKGSKKTIIWSHPIEGSKDEEKKEMTNRGYLGLKGSLGNQ